MKNFSEIQLCIKTRDYLNFIFDFELLFSFNENKLGSETANIVMNRILQNYARKEFINIVILFDGNKKLLKKFDTTLINYTSAKDFEIPGIIEKFHTNPFLSVYFGEDPKIIKKIKNEDVTVCFTGSNIQGIKSKVDFKSSENQMREFLIQTCNLYL